MSYWGQKTFLEDLNFRGQRSLTRVDFNVPLDAQQQVSDNHRVMQALPTIRHIVEQGGRAVLMSHLGRPGGEQVSELSLRPAAEELSQLLGTPVTLAPDCVGAEVEAQVQALQDGEVVLLENLRYHKAET
ncbi:MAG: phosphoglycerate kinase, partial [SAR324 cluster bacterium]|nr:phosphoglycerate kinase [SAR324 cluster bacterium]